MEEMGGNGDSEEVKKNEGVQGSVFTVGGYAWLLSGCKAIPLSCHLYTGIQIYLGILRASRFELTAHK